MRKLTSIIMFSVLFSATSGEETQRPSYLVAQAQFAADYGENWQVQWSPHETPHRLIGDRIPQFFDARDAVLSEAAAREFIDRNDYLFRIGNSDLELWVNEKRGRIRYLIFNQTYEEIPVYNGRIDFRYTLEGDLVLIGHDAFPEIEVNTSPALTADMATISAQADVEFDETKGDFIDGEPQPFIWVEDGKSPIYHLSWQVELFTRGIVSGSDLPSHRWKIFVDAHSGEILEKIDLAASATISGYVTGMVKDEPYGEEEERGLQHVKVQVSGVGNTFTDANGWYSIEIGNQSRTVTVELQGQFINCENSNGSDAAISRTAIPGSTENFHFEDVNSLPGERDTYYHGNFVHDLAVSIDESFTGADYIMPANVNIGPEDPYWPCNAYWDGYTINMFSEGGGCAGTEEMADVVYHEYGHGLQQFIYDPYSPPYSSGMGEGCSDFWSMSITSSPCLGNGFFGPGTCLRDGNNTRQYPAPECGGSVHCLGEITMGSLWKMRENFITSLGYDVAKAHSDTLFFFAQVARPTTVPDFLMEILLVDDDDGYLVNGTPNYGDICGAFEAHNVICPFDDIGIEHMPLDNTTNYTTPYIVEAAIASVYGEITSVNLNYSLDYDYIATEMEQSGDLYLGEIPAQPAGTIVDYYIHATDSEGNEVFSPENAPQETYLFLVGEEQDFMIPFADDFEEELDWTAGLPGDDATTGIWIRGEPNGTSVGGVVVQPDEDHTPDGTQAFVTGNAPFTGNNAGEDDVDDGRTTLLSPVWDLSYVSNPVLSYWRWYSNDVGDNPGSDVWEVEVSSDGEYWVALEYTSQSSGAWIQKQFKLSKFVDVSGDVQARFVASDEGDGSLVEAAVDDVVILAVVAFNGVYGDVNGDGVVAVEDIILVIDFILGRIEFTQLQRIAADLDDDNDVDIMDVIRIVNIILGNNGGISGWDVLLNDSYNY